MRKIIDITLFTAALFFTLSGFGQAKNPADSVVLKTSMHCDNCIKRIEKTIPFEKGVKEVRTDLATKTVTVFYDGQKTDTQKIVDGFSKIKMEATVVND